MKTRDSATPAVAAALAKIKSGRDQLSELDNEIVKRIGEIEVALHQLHVGVDLMVCINEDELRREPCPEAYLEFGKVGGKWRLVVNQYLEGDPEPLISSHPLTDLRRNYRAEVLEKHVPRLLIKAADLVEELVAGRRETLAKSADVLALFETLGGEA